MWVGYLSGGNINNSMTAPVSDPVPITRRPRIWCVFIWAAVIPVLVALAVWPMLASESTSTVAVLLFCSVLFPAASICEALGLGQLSILGSSTIPDAVLIAAMILVAYFYGLVPVAFSGAVGWACGKLVSWAGTK
jgi:hypothetical protein